MPASFKTLKAAYLPVLITYFAYGASGITSVAALYFQKDALGITPAEAAAIAFWVGLPWSMKMVVGVSSDVYPILGSRRKAYLFLGTLGRSAATPTSPAASRARPPISPRWCWWPSAS